MAAEDFRAIEDQIIPQEHLTSGKPAITSNSFHNLFPLYFILHEIITQWWQIML